MTQRAMPFDGTDYFESDWRDVLWAGVLKDGVRKGEDNELSAFGDGSGLNVKVRTGKATVRRMTYYNDAEVTLTVGANVSGSTRIDRVIIRFNFVNNTGVLVVKEGTPGAGAPALTQTTTEWEISLAQVSIPNNDTTIDAGQVTDERAFVTSQEPLVCTSTTRPASPSDGMLIFETDTGLLRIRRSGAWQEVLQSSLTDLDARFDPRYLKKIAEHAPGANQTIFSFTSIPNTYRSLLIHVNGRGSAASSQEARMRFNNDTTSSYETQQLTADGTSVTGSRAVSAYMPVGLINSVNLPQTSSLIIEVPSHAQTSGAKPMFSRSSHNTGTAHSMRQYHGYWNNGGAITQLDLFLASGDWTSGSRAVLWGIPL